MRSTFSRLASFPRSGPALLLAGRAVQLANGLLLSTLLVRRFGLATVGSFAIGIAAINVLANVCPLGLAAYLPRLKQSHAQSCFAALVLQLAQLPIVLASLWLYASMQAHDASEHAIILLVATSGFFIGLTNTGLMLSIMGRRFAVGLAAPLCETAGLLAGALYATTPTGFAAALLGCRVVSTLVIWAGLNFELVAPTELLLIARTSVRYLATDILAILPEQSVPLLLATFVSRSELGMFRLCQQLLMAADSPGWTFVQSKYPQMVDCEPAFFEALTRQVRRIALLASAACLVGSFVISFWFFETPKVAFLMMVLSGCLFWRYDNYFYGQALRAAGKIRILTGLGFARLAGAAFLFYFAVLSFGLWGAVFALAILSVLSGLTYERVFLHHGLATVRERVA